MTPQEMLREFVQITKDLRAAEEAVNGFKKQLDAMQQPLQEYFMDQGIQNMNLDGMTVYMSVTQKVRPKDGKDKVIEALQATGHTEIVNVNYHWKQLNSLVTGYLAEGDDLPPELEAVLEINDEYKVIARRA